VRVLDLFSGIGGLSLGLHWAGMRTVAFCERDAWCRRVLARHWPGVPAYDDVRALTAARLRADGVPGPDLVCGGFPCQDVSAAGRGGGIDGARSGLWREMERLVAELRPGWVVAENSPALRVRGADRVCAGLETLGYACWPLVVGAAHAGAPHRRERVFILAHGPARDVADAAGAGLAQREPEPACEATGLLAARPGGWQVAPPLRRVADGLPGGVDRERVDRVRALGNAVVPQVAEMIGRAILHAAAHAVFESGSGAVSLLSARR
jgi:DNA (cytosine-5)-methyltransferase 1